MNGGAVLLGWPFPMPLVCPSSDLTPLVGAVLFFLGADLFMEFTPCQGLALEWAEAAVVMGVGAEVEVEVDSLMV